MVFCKSCAAYLRSICSLKRKTVARIFFLHLWISYFCHRCYKCPMIEKRQDENLTKPSTLLVEIFPHELSHASLWQRFVEERYANRYFGTKPCTIGLFCRGQMYLIYLNSTQRWPGQNFLTNSVGPLSQTESFCPSIRGNEQRSNKQNKQLSRPADLWWRKKILNKS